MNKLKYVLIAILLAASAGHSLAAGKVAVIDVQRAIMETNTAKKRIKAMSSESDYKANMREAEKIKKEGEALVEKLKKDGPVMGKEQKANLQKRIQEKQADLEHVARKVQGRQQAVMQEIMIEKQSQAQDVINKIIKSEGIGLLLDSRSALHAEPGYDITAKVTKKLNDGK